MNTTLRLKEVRKASKKKLEKESNKGESKEVKRVKNNLFGFREGFSGLALLIRSDKRQGFFIE